MLRKFLFFIFFILISIVLSIEFLERSFSQSSTQTINILFNELTAVRSPIEQRADELRNKIAKEFQLPLLKLLRFGMHPGLEKEHLLGRLNPVAWRITFSPKLQELAPDEQDSIILHEIAHAIAISKGLKTNYGQKTQTQRYLKDSLLAHQIFHEAFSDSFATLWLLKENPTNQYAWRILSTSYLQPQFRYSLAHDTFLAMRLALHQAVKASTMNSQEFLKNVHDIASQATVLTIAHQNLERETGCALNSRGLAKYVRNLAYAAPVLPWEVAPTHEAVEGEPFYEAILEIQMLRHLTPKENPWRLAISKTQEAVERALNLAVNSKINPNGAGNYAANYLISAFPESINEEMFAAHVAAKQLSYYRTNPVRQQLYSILLSWSALTNVPKTEGCVD